jgi:hypothetical protein
MNEVNSLFKVDVHMVRKILKENAATNGTPVTKTEPAPVEFKLPTKPGEVKAEPKVKTKEELAKEEAAKKQKEEEKKKKLEEKAAKKALSDAEKKRKKEEREKERAEKAKKKAEAKAAGQAAPGKYDDIPGVDYKPNFISKPALELLMKVALPKAIEKPAKEGETEPTIEWLDAGNVLVSDYNKAVGGDTAMLDAYMADKNKSTVKCGQAVNVVLKFLETEVLPDLIDGFAHDAWIKSKRMTSAPEGKEMSPPRIYAGGKTTRKGKPSIRENEFMFCTWPGKDLYNEFDPNTNTYKPKLKYYGVGTDIYHIFTAKFAAEKIGTVSKDVAEKLAKPRAKKMYAAQMKAWTSKGKTKGAWTMGKGKSAKSMNGEPKMPTDEEINKGAVQVSYASPSVLGNIQLIGDRMINRIAKGAFKVRPPKKGAKKEGTGMTQAEADRLNSLVPTVEGKKLKFMLSGGLVPVELKAAAASASAAWDKTVKTKLEGKKVIITSDDAALRAKAMVAKKAVIEAERNSSSFFMIEKLISDYAVMICQEAGILLKSAKTQKTLTPPLAWAGIQNLQKKLQQDAEIAKNKMKSHELSGQSKTVLFFKS